MSKEQDGTELALESGTQQQQQQQQESTYAEGVTQPQQQEQTTNTKYEYTDTTAEGVINGNKWNKNGFGQGRFCSTLRLHFVVCFKIRCLSRQH